jgi:transcriptional regulator with XRE-family HTH domain
MVGMTVKLLRTERRITRRQLAGLAKVDRNTVGRIERGDGNVGIDVLDNLSQGFGMTTWELLRAVVHYAHTLKYL